MNLRSNHSNNYEDRIGARKSPRRDREQNWKSQSQSDKETGAKASTREPGTVYWDHVKFWQLERERWWQERDRDQEHHLKDRECGRHMDQRGDRERDREHDQREHETDQEYHYVSRYMRARAGIPTLTGSPTDPTSLITYPPDSVGVLQRLKDEEVKWMEVEWQREEEEAERLPEIRQIAEGIHGKEEDVKTRKDEGCKRELEALKKVQEASRKEMEGKIKEEEMTMREKKLQENGAVNKLFKEQAAGKRTHEVNTKEILGKLEEIRKVIKRLGEAEDWKNRSQPSTPLQSTISQHSTASAPQHLSMLTHSSQHPLLTTQQSPFTPQSPTPASGQYPRASQYPPLRSGYYSSVGLPAGMTIPPISQIPMVPGSPPARPNLKEGVIHLSSEYPAGKLMDTSSPATVIPPGVFKSKETRLDTSRILQCPFSSTLNSSDNSPSSQVSASQVQVYPRSIYQNGSSLSGVIPLRSALSAMSVTPERPLEPQREARRTQPVDLPSTTYEVDHKDEPEFLTSKANQIIGFPLKNSQRGTAPWIVTLSQPPVPRKPMFAQFTSCMAGLRRQFGGPSSTSSSRKAKSISIILGSQASTTSSPFSELASQAVVSLTSAVEFSPTPVFTDHFPKGLTRKVEPLSISQTAPPRGLHPSRNSHPVASTRSLDTAHGVAGGFATPSDFDSRSRRRDSSSRKHESNSRLGSGKQRPRNTVRRGYWNRRGDHLTPEGYIVLSPPNMQYPEELRTYPSEKEGYRDHTGLFTAYVRRPKLPQSLSKYGKPPEHPYESFLIYV